jgi:hypothetical protein
MIDTSDAVVRLLWDYSPDILNELDTGMEGYPNIDPDWVWVAWENEKVVASLFAAPAHGVALLLRLNSRAANPMTLRKLLGVALQSLKERGYNMFFSFLSATEAKELKLARVAQRYGCQLLPFSGYIVCGRIK